MKHLLLLIILLYAAPLHAQQMPLRFSGLARACAGGVADETHTIRLHVALTSGDARTVQFRLDANTAARFVEENGELTTTQNLLMAPGKNIALCLRSGARAETPFLTAFDGDQEIGRVQLDFGLPVLYRRFSDDNDEISPNEDTGFLSSADEKSGKYYLKFRKDLSRGDVNGNWAPVVGHRLRVYPSEADARAETGELVHDPAKLAKYLRVVDPKYPQAKECILTTRADGSVLFRVEYFHRDADSFTIAADDLLAPDDNYLTPGEPDSQTLREYSQETKPQWLAPPDDLSLRVLWEASKQKMELSNVFAWRDAENGAWQEKQSLKISDSDKEGFYITSFSPDAQQALFALGNYDFDLAHDLVISDLKSGSTRRLRKGLFGQSEVFSPDGKKISFVDGSRDMLGSGRIGSTLSLRVLNLATSAEATLLTDDNLNRDALAWTQNGDLLAGTSVVVGHFKAYGRVQEKRQQVILRFKNGGAKKTTWQTRASSPLPSPDGKHIAFIGPEKAPDGNWRDTSSAINVARDDGTQRRALTRLSDGTRQMFWSPDGKTLYCWSFWVGAHQHDIVSSPTLNAKKPQPKPIPVELSLVSYDVASRARRTIANIKATYFPYSDDDFPRLDWNFKAFGITSNGKYLLFHRVEYKPREATETSALLKLAADSLHAIRLTDGKLIPLAVLDKPLEAAPR